MGTKTKELEELCVECGLRKSGKKAVLIDRLIRDPQRSDSPLKKLRPAKLQELCERFGVSKSGSKDLLIGRIISVTDSSRAEDTVESPSSAPPPSAEDPIELSDSDSTSSEEYLEESVDSATESGEEGTTELPVESPSTISDDGTVESTTDSEPLAPFPTDLSGYDALTPSEAKKLCRMRELIKEGEKPSKADLLSRLKESDPRQPSS